MITNYSSFNNDPFSLKENVMAKLEMKVPSPGESISEVEIAQWLVSDGDFVEKDQPIAEVDSDKATLELPAEESGVITLKANEGDTVKVGDGPFEGQNGVIEQIDHETGKLLVSVTIFGRATPVELESWQVENA